MAHPDSRQPLDQLEIRERLASFVVTPGAKVRLPTDFDPSYRGDFVRKSDAEAALHNGVVQLGEYQARLAAQSTHGLLVVLQAIDAAGKDGTIRHVLSGVNPQGVTVTSFKVPSVEELQHDFLWRYQRALPGRGQIGIFNRSHYEEVLVVRVHPDNLVRQHLPKDSLGKDIWARRYREINDWERYLVANGIRVVKLFLNLSKEEQRKRFLARIDHPEKNWKFSAADAIEREHWDAYQRAFASMLSNTSTDAAPWHVVPADHKWFARLSASWIILDALMRIDPRYPAVDKADKAAMVRIRQQLVDEAPPAS
jgi:PPK2 family polyphosphate:nucleotide phosphotransferase